MRRTARRTVRRRLKGSQTLTISPRRPRRYRSGALGLILGFAAVLVPAVLLLLLPIASSGAAPSVLDAAFTAISAICVTGLVVVETQTQWSHFGEAVILALIQIGGLGYMAGMGLVLWMLGRNLGLRDRDLIRLYSGAPSMRESAGFIRAIVLYTLTFEALGMLALFGGFVSAGVPVGRSLWWAVFHAISAFNVAGFNITGEDMRPFADDPAVLIPMIVLCLAGSLGAVPVILGLWRLGPDQLWLRVRRKRTPEAKQGEDRISLDAKVVLTAAACVIAGAALFIGISEWANTGTLASVGAGDRPLLALFQASMWVSGFSAVDSGLLHEHTKLFESVLMLVGGAAGSPAGGLKLGTLAVLVAGTIAALRGRDTVVVFKRRLPPTVIRQAVAIVFAFAAVHFIVSMVLLRTTGAPFIDVLYETSSAVGTVGWSAGITPTLGTAATVVVMVTMLVGRFLPLVLVLQIARQRARPVRVQLVDNVRLG